MDLQNLRTGYHIENDYVQAVMAELGKHQSFQDKTVFLLTEREEPPWLGSKVVVVYTCDERCIVPRYAGDVLAVFMQHPPLAIKDYPPNVFIFPLGITSGFGMRRSLIPYSQRTVDVFFAGSAKPGTSREAMLSEVVRLGPIHPGWRMNILNTGTHFHEGGWSIAQYRELADRTRVALCPHGSSGPTYNNPQTLRFFEAAACGCVVIGSENMPEFYRDAPYCKAHDDWSNLEELLREILSNPLAAEEDAHAMRFWWEAKAAPDAVARAMAAKLTLLEARL